MALLRRRKFRKRQYIMERAFQTCELDLAFLKPYKNYIGFIVAVDVFNRMIFTQAIKSKKKEEIEKQLEVLFKRCGKFNVVTTDGELEYLKSYFKNLGMYLR